MSTQPNIVVHFKEVEHDDALRDHVHARCGQLAEEFPEATHFELTVEPGVHCFDSHGHVSGKRTRAAAHASGAERPRQAVDAVLDKLERELRTDHDKRIFTQRRKAQQASTKQRG